MVKEKPGTTSKGERSQNIQVAVRCRPTSQYEMKLSSPNAVEIDPKSRDITVRQDISYLDKGNQKTFQFDKVFGPKSKQIDVYKEMVAISTLSYHQSSQHKMGKQSMIEKIKKAKTIS